MNLGEAYSLVHINMKSILSINNEYTPQSTSTKLHFILPSKHGIKNFFPYLGQTPTKSSAFSSFFQHYCTLSL